MGCVGSTERSTSEAGFSSVKAGKGTKPVKWVSGGYKWTSAVPITAAELLKQREEFWETQPSYGGDRVIWDALKAACETDTETARLIIESAGIIVTAPDMTVAYDERGAKYELPKYVLSNPLNLKN